jgi:uncharacterized protein YcfL
MISPPRHSGFMPESILPPHGFKILSYTRQGGRVMRKLFFTVLTFLILIAGLTACGSGQQVKVNNNLQSTDLSGIEIQGLKIGVSIEDVDLSRYTAAPSGQTSIAEYAWHFNEVDIAADEKNAITKIRSGAFAYSNADDTLIFSQGSSIVDEVIDILGEDFENYWFDREQQIKANTYVDKEHGLSLTVTYDALSTDNGLVWVILAKNSN